MRFLVENRCMSSPLNILFKPKSILGLLVAAGILFLLIGGGLISVSGAASAFFISTGGLLLFIGLVGWAFFVIPTIARNFARR